MTKRVTISDIAAAVGVSKTTISRYLNGHYEYMSPETKGEIERVIRETNYSPSNLARGLKSRRSNLVGILPNTLLHQVVALFVRGVHDICVDNGYGTIISSSDDLLHREVNGLKTCLSQQVDGIALIPVNMDCSYYHKINEGGTPMVMCNRYREDWRYDGVYVDNVALTRQAWEHLLDNGYERIAFITDNELPESNKTLRESTFVRFVAERLGMDGNEWLFRVGQSPELTRNALQTFVRRFPKERKAVFAINTNTLLLTLGEIRKLGLEIPRDLGICGYDLLGWSELIPPGITTLKQPLYELGVVAGKQLLRRIDSQLYQEPEEIWLKGTLEIRDSTQRI